MQQIDALFAHMEFLGDILTTKKSPPTCEGHSRVSAHVPSIVAYLQRHLLSTCALDDKLTRELRCKRRCDLLEVLQVRHTSAVDKLYDVTLKQPCDGGRALHTHDNDTAVVLCVHAVDLQGGCCYLLSKSCFESKRGESSLRKDDYQVSKKVKLLMQRLTHKNK